ncbi:nitrous oxide reductase accessory protein NosL [Desulfuromonas soudanensis]|uniref:Nitrous oxide reductase accessory protein NosL n=1 Tax=Desulfuromonas soudanensis TaxID=1603606 RepID=A0A0M4D5G4_9BACT|nr:nitrous oxide reductase accessory protein NosL [Desulfuromonas soudanensis]ALC18088.1 nitrous oxide reductase accessory protein NosL [Desulfuromonas soudanensis]
MTRAGKLLLMMLGLSLFVLPGIVCAEEVSLPGPKERCVVCGMFVAPYPEWVASIEFRDGTTAFFDGPKDMFVYFFDLEKYRPGAKPDDIVAMVVTEYYTARPMPVGEVFFVSGSDVLGPMGYELVPVAGKENAETFMRDHGGKKIMQFNGLDFSEIPAGK